MWTQKNISPPIQKHVIIQNAKALTSPGNYTHIAMFLTAYFLMLIIHTLYLLLRACDCSVLVILFETKFSFCCMYFTLFSKTIVVYSTSFVEHIVSFGVHIFSAKAHLLGAMKNDNLNNSLSRRRLLLL